VGSHNFVTCYHLYNCPGTIYQSSLMENPLVGRNFRRSSYSPPVADPSGRAVFCRLIAGTAGSNPAESMRIPSLVFVV
jgi:hypothetical protein